MDNDPLVKLSDDDCYRLFAEVKSEDFIFEYFHNLGATTICLTKGKKGEIISDLQQGLFFQKAIQIDEIKDTTEEGYAFWKYFFMLKSNKKPLTKVLLLHKNWLQ